MPYWRLFCLLSKQKRQRESNDWLQWPQTLYYIMELCFSVTWHPLKLNKLLNVVLFFMVTLWGPQFCEESVHKFQFQVSRESVNLLEVDFQGEWEFQMLLKLRKQISSLNGVTVRCVPPVRTRRCCIVGVKHSITAIQKQIFQKLENKKAARIIYRLFKKTVQTILWLYLWSYTLCQQNLVDFEHPRDEI